jgi:hypothetical protein
LYSPKIEKHFFDSRGSSTIIEEALDQHYYKFLNYIEVQTTTLDDYLKNHKPPTVIKMDVEGAEKLVIEGGINFFKNKSPIIIMEVWASKEGGEISEKSVEMLKKIEYEPYFINMNGDLENIKNKNNISQIVDNENLFADNFVFIKD